MKGQPDSLTVRRNIVYERDGNFCRAVYPMPVLIPFSCSALHLPLTPSGEAQAVFREDSFDPVTRLRRGRVYTHADTHQFSLPSENVYNGQYGPLIGAQPNFVPDACYEPLRSLVDGRTLNHYAEAELGEAPLVTLWRVVAMERIATGEFLFTLRSLASYGVLPKLATTLPALDNTKPSRDAVEEALSALVDTYNRQQATSTVDAARETVRVILAAWIGDEAHSKDLANVIKLIPEDRKIACWAASIVNRLHPRGKSAEREKQANAGVALREPSGEDAEASVHLIGMLLREIGWTVT